MVLIIMGVSGSGKTTVGRMLAELTGLPFSDADDFHSSHNIDKMKQSIPLTDADRKPWLDALARHISELNRAGGGVLACSALKEEYRVTLSRDGSESVLFVYLKGSKSAIRGRMSLRKGHFMQPGLLDSQFETLEEPSNALTVSAKKRPKQVCEAIIKALADRGLFKAAI